MDWLQHMALPMIAGVAFVYALDGALNLWVHILRARRDAAALATQFKRQSWLRGGGGFVCAEFDVKRRRDWLFVWACKRHVDLCVAVNKRHVTVALRSERPPEGLRQ